MDVEAEKSDHSDGSLSDSGWGGSDPEWLSVAAVFSEQKSNEQKSEKGKEMHNHDQHEDAYAKKKLLSAKLGVSFATESLKPTEDSRDTWLPL